METEERVEQIIKELSKDEWDKLFSLLPEIEATDQFRLPQSEEDDDLTYAFFQPSIEIVSTVHDVLYKLDLIPAFDWKSWEEGQAMMNNNAFNFSSLDTITLCKLLTIIVRTDRFNTGYMVSQFENGNMIAILRAMQRNETKEK